MNDTTTTSSTEQVFRRLEEPLRLFGNTVPPWVWLLILGGVLFLGFVYIVLMYIKDSKTIGAWAFVLGLLRASVYVVLALVFLMPAEQTWHESRQRSKVIVLMDASLSMSTARDDIPTPPQTYKDMKTRTEKLIDLIDSERIQFMGRLTEKNPVTVHRFGRGLDSDFLLFERNEGGPRFWPRSEREKLASAGSKDDRETLRERFPGYLPNRAHWDAFLTPVLEEQMQDRLPANWQKSEGRAKLLLEQAKSNNKKLVEKFYDGTTLGESLREVITQERNNMVEGIIVFTDGRLTGGSPSSVREAAAAATDARIPIFVVQVGDVRPKVSIDIVDISVPMLIRPEDRFHVAVSVTGEDMRPNEPFDIFLDITRVVTKDREKRKPGEEEKTKPIELVILDKKGNLTDAKPIPLGDKITLDKTYAREKPVFKDGTPPNCQVEFELNAAQLAKAAGKTLNLAPGETVGLAPDDDSEIRFVARVPKDKREVTEKTEHRSENAEMRVQKKPLRVLLFASAATREYQFLRTLLVREMDKQRAEVCIYLQNVPGGEKRSGIVQDIDEKRMLVDFPTKKLSPKGDDRPFYALSNYDVIVAFDANWIDDLSPEQTKLLSDWVYQDGGGLVFIAGQLNTQELVNPNLAKVEKYRNILDMLPVIPEYSQKEDSTTDIPRRLEFPQASPDMEYLRLDENDPKAEWKKGWERFFNEIQEEDGTSKMVEASATPERGIYTYYPTKKVKDNALNVLSIDAPTALLPGSGRKQPWMSIGPWGQGKVVWLASGETWRLRMFKETYHERFWTKLLREVGSASLHTSNKRITPIMLPRNGKVNETKDFELRFKDVNGEPVRNSVKPPPKLQITLPPLAQAQVKDRVLIKEGDHANRKATVLEILIEREPEKGAEIRRLKLGNIEGVEDKTLTVILPPAKVELLAEDILFRPKEGDSAELNKDNDGKFKVTFQPRVEGEYKLKVVYEDSPDNYYDHKFRVERTNPETDQVKPDPTVLWELATSAEPVLERIKNDQTKDMLRRMLKRPEGVVEKENKENKDKKDKKPEGANAERDGVPRLFFNLDNAYIIPDCMDRQEKNLRNRGKIDDLWDDGFIEVENEQGEKRPLLPYVLCVAAGLLSLEWLLRKLMRLA